MSDKILRFTASWCGPCASLAKNLEGVDVGLPVEVIDIDADSTTASRFGIRGIPTLIVIKNDQEVGRKSGVMSAADIRTWVESV